MDVSPFFCALERGSEGEEFNAKAQGEGEEACR